MNIIMKMKKRIKNIIKLKIHQLYLLIKMIIIIEVIGDVILIKKEHQLIVLMVNVMDKNQCFIKKMVIIDIFIIRKESIMINTNYFLYIINKK